MKASQKDFGFRFQIACTWEAASRKVGNVHPNASFSDVDFVSFILSAASCGWVLDVAAGRGDVGLIVNRAVMATQWAINSNTNLGIILLIAPFVASNGIDERGGVNRVLQRLTVSDTCAVYEAIRLAAPGGLGDAPEQDVRNEPTVTLLEAMTLAADRDLIARQYANGFADVFDFGVPAFLAAFAKFDRIEPAVIECQLRWLAEYPDSLIARKNGPTVAEDVRRRAADVLALGGLDTSAGRAAGVALDRHLRSDGNKLNPGTTADLVTACLFVALRENKVKPADPFRWDVPDWL